MDGKKGGAGTVEEYVGQLPVEVQQIMQKIRGVIRENAPEAVEKISYGMIGYFQGGGLVWFGAWKRHIGFYPRSEAMLREIPELAAYKGTKGSVHFPLDQPMPYELIARIVKVRGRELGIAI